MYKLKIVNLILIFVILFTLSATAMSQEKVAELNSDSNDLSLTIVYDNNPYGKNLETRWGFSCYVKGTEKTILFDVGGEGSVVLANMRKPCRPLDSALYLSQFYAAVGLDRYVQQSKVSSFLKTGTILALTMTRP